MCCDREEAVSDQLCLREGGTVPGSKKHPDQIGNIGSPRSNSTQTLARMGGKALPSFFEVLFGGTQGIAHSARTSDRSVSATWTRPIFVGSRSLITVARYLPKYFALMAPSFSLLIKTNKPQPGLEKRRDLLGSSYRGCLSGLIRRRLSQYC
jgi:hypothetical protein